MKPPTEPRPPTLPSVESAERDSQVHGTLRRRNAERLAVATLGEASRAVGVEALAAFAGLDRGLLFAQASGRRPPHLSTMVALLWFDPLAGRQALSRLAREVGCELVASPGQSSSPQPEGPGLVAIVAQLIDELERCGVVDQVERERARIRASRAR